MSYKTPVGMDRRRFLRYASALGAASALTASLSACGGPASTGSETSDVRFPGAAAREQRFRPPAHVPSQPME